MVGDVDGLTEQGRGILRAGSAPHVPGNHSAPPKFVQQQKFLGKTDHSLPFLSVDHDEWRDIMDRTLGHLA